MSELCSVCQLEPFKYKCPACGTRSCSLICVKRHKLDTPCTGEVDPTKYVTKNELTLTEVNRDYNFLLNVNRKISVGKDDAKHTKLLLQTVMKRPFKNGNRGPNKRIFTNSFEDSNISIKRGVNVKYVPKGMSRSNVNKTGFDKKKNCFNWTIEWFLVDNNLGNVLHKFTSYKCDEASKLIDCFPSKNFSKFLDSANPVVVENNPQETEKETEPPQSRNFNFFIKNYTNSTSKKLYSLDPNKLVAEILKNKTVLEFPTIYVSLEREIEGFKIFNDGSDDDSDSDSSSDSDESSSDSDEESSSSDDDEAPEETTTKEIDTDLKETVPLTELDNSS